MTQGRFIACLGLAGLVAGCAETQLRPALEAEAFAGAEFAAIERINGVQVVARPGWGGGLDITTKVTPMLVSINNNGSTPIRVSYENMALISRSGERYSALPPFQIDATVPEPVATSPYGVMAEPGFAYDNFAVAPYYDPLYPSIGFYSGPFYTDPLYYDTYYDYWAQVELPTEQMVQVALPEGVIQPGGSTSGYVYFEHVPAEAQQVMLRFDVINVETGQQYGQISIPFKVV